MFELFANLFYGFAGALTARLLWEGIAQLFKRRLIEVESDEDEDDTEMGEKVVPPYVYTVLIPEHGTYL